MSAPSGSCFDCWLEDCGSPDVFCDCHCHEDAPEIAEEFEPESVGPWRLQYDEHGETRRGWHLGDIPVSRVLRTIWLDAAEFTEAEALAVRDALNRVARRMAGEDI